MVNFGMDDGFMRIDSSFSETGSSIYSGGKRRKKKKTKNPFYFFMMEKKEEWLTEGRWKAHWSMEELVQNTLPLWHQNKENPGFMEPYIEMHRQWKLKEQNDLENKYDSHGRSLADIAREAERQRKMRRDMEEDIRLTVSSPGVETKKFYFAHFNYLCRTDDDFFVPCEASVVEFSLREGMTRCWAELVSPLDSIPLGYAYRCVYHSRVTHNLTVDFEHYETDYSLIVRSLATFLNGGRRGAGCEVAPRALPPVYTMPGLEAEAASCILRFMLDKAGLAQATFSVYPMPHLLYSLSPHVMPSVDFAERLLEEDPYSHHAGGLACWLHESLKNRHHCSLNIACRHVFTFFDRALRSLAHIGKIEGRHFPMDLDEDESTDPRTEFLVSNASLVKEERINRLIPAPCGFTRLPRVFDESYIIHHGGHDKGIVSGSSERPTGGNSKSKKQKKLIQISNKIHSNKKPLHKSDFQDSDNDDVEVIGSLSSRLSETRLNNVVLNIKPSVRVGNELTEDIRFKGYSMKN